MVEVRRDSILFDAFKRSLENIRDAGSEAERTQATTEYERMKQDYIDDGSSSRDVMDAYDQAAREEVFGPQN